MTKLEEIFKKFSEKAKLNYFEGYFVGSVPEENFEFPVVLELLWVEDKDFLFRCGSTPLRVHADKGPSLRKSILPDGSFVYDYFFWFDKSDYDKDAPSSVTVHFLQCGHQEIHKDIDVAYDEGVILYITQRGQKTTNLGQIPDILKSWFVFSAPNGDYLFIETSPNNERTFRIHGLNGICDISVEDNKWVIRRISKQKFSNRYDDFLSYKVVKYESVNFVDRLKAREAMETISSQASKSGGTVITLWQEYSKIEKEKALDLKKRLGKIKFSDARQKSDGITSIKLEPDEEQETIINNERDEFVSSSFNTGSPYPKFTLKSYDRYSKVATVQDDDYPIRQNASGYIEVDTSGDETVERRRQHALRQFEDKNSFILINLRLAIEGYAGSMIPKPRKLAPLSSQTRKFIKEKFGIDHLTDDQKEAVDIAINTPDIAVIQGPPGTGKSTVVAVICQRLIELSENKEDRLDKVILASAFQNDTVEHIASKIETFGLPTIKVGKDVLGVRAEEEFIMKMRNSIDNAIHRLAPEYSTGRKSQKLAELKLLLEKEHNSDEVKTRIKSIIGENDIDESLYNEWRNISREDVIGNSDNNKAILALKGLRTNREAYSDDGYAKIRKVLLAGIQFNDHEREFLENAPYSEDEIPDDFLNELNNIREKYLTALYDAANVVRGGVDISLSAWLDEAIRYFKKKEESSYDDFDTFLAATLQNLREDLFGSSEYIRETIQHYGQSVAATNQYSGTLNDIKYENVILEEAARSNPLDILIPMVRATERVILVGDQFQLPHLLESDIVDEAVKGDADEQEKRKRYQESLFGIIFNNLSEAKPTRRITLTKQFRMHPVIGDFISKTYYNGIISSELVDVESKLHHLSIPWAKDKVAVFCDVPSSEGHEQRKGRSKVREAEAKRIVELMNELKTDSAFENLSVGVITFYSSQVDVICDEAAKAGYTELQGDGSYRTAPQYQRTPDGREKLRIGTVDSFQGKEFDIVILSTVRSNAFSRIDENNRKIFGFLTLENRLNVAFSRAQKLIVAVGDGQMFSDEFAESYVKGLHDFYTNLSNGEYGSRIS